MTTLNTKLGFTYIYTQYSRQAICHVVAQYHLKQREQQTTNKHEVGNTHSDMMCYCEYINMGEVYLYPLAT